MTMMSLKPFTKSVKNTTPSLGIQALERDLYGHIGKMYQIIAFFFFTPISLRISKCMILMLMKPSSKLLNSWSMSQRFSS